MVISNPTPHQIGKEFVKQYYTTLHESPDQLYRFYSADSSYVHGGWDRTGEADVVYGADQILKKVKELNFVQCHTKILQVDSFQTLGDGIVIQDDVFDTITTNDASKEYVKKLEENDDRKSISHGKDDGSPAISNAIPDSDILPQRTNRDKAKVDENEYFATNGGAQSFTFEENMDTSKTFEKSISNDFVSPSNDAADVNKSEQQTNGNISKIEYDNSRISSVDAECSNSQRSWAAIASQNKEKSFEPSSSTVMAPKASRSPKPVVNSTAAVGSESNKTARSADARYSDSHQVFIGNLNVSTSEENLRSFFSEFGKIVEVRLNDKPVVDKPNYAFVVFESPGSVDNLIAESKKHLLKLDGQRLNIERKNSRPTSFRGPKPSNRNFGAFNKQDRVPINTKAY